MAWRRLGVAAFAAHALGGGEGDLVSYIERRGQLGRHRLPAQPVLPRQPGHAGGFRTQDVDAAGRQAAAPCRPRRRPRHHRRSTAARPGASQTDDVAPRARLRRRRSAWAPGASPRKPARRLPFLPAGRRPDRLHSCGRPAPPARPGPARLRSARPPPNAKPPAAPGYPVPGPCLATPQATRKPVNPPGPWPNATACSAPGQSRLGQQFAGHGQQPLGVLLGSFVLTDGDVQPAVGRAQQGDAAARRRGFQSQQV